MTASIPPPTKVYEDLLKGKTVDLVVEHELRGVTPEMIDWWWDHMDNSTYALWHPEDHIAMEWQLPPSKVGGYVGAIHMVCEKVSEMPAIVIRIRREDPRSSPISTIYSHVIVSSILGPSPDDKPVGCIVHEYEATSYGTQMRSTFRFSGDMPQQFLDALRRHNIREMGRFPEFLPELYKQEVG